MLCRLLLSLCATVILSLPLSVPALSKPSLISAGVSNAYSNEADDKAVADGKQLLAGIPQWLRDSFEPAAKQSGLRATANLGKFWQAGTFKLQHSVTYERNDGRCYKTDEMVVTAEAFQRSEAEVFLKIEITKKDRILLRKLDGDLPGMLSNYTARAMRNQISAQYQAFWVNYLSGFKSLATGPTQADTQSLYSLGKWLDKQQMLQRALDGMKASTAKYMNLIGKSYKVVGYIDGKLKRETVRTSSVTEAVSCDLPLLVNMTDEGSVVAGEPRSFELTSPQVNSLDEEEELTAQTRDLRYLLPELSSWQGRYRTSLGGISIVGGPSGFNVIPDANTYLTRSQVDIEVLSVTPDAIEGIYNSFLLKEIGNFSWSRKGNSFTGELITQAQGRDGTRTRIWKGARESQ
ncbi:MAG: hypothetical protein AAFP80_13640 [Pseudomonadota bacterium]